uniref:Uncharacterized protein n=1 Tax=Arion vulgaris TaxID=1028688 RepID=A0A0B7A393_9EUPU
MRSSWDHIVLVLWLLSICTFTCSGNEDIKSRKFNHFMPSGNNFQSWDDWLTKRNLGDQHWNVGELPQGTFQNWQEYFRKRGLDSPNGLDNFGVFDQNKFQEWKDWVSKRGFDSRSLFSGSSDFDRNQLQQWNDWISKRNLDIGVDGFGHGPSTSVGLQNWADFAKRQSFVYPSSNMGMSGSVHFQDWQDWVKRMGTEKSWALNGYRFGNKDRFIKRQLGFSPDRYGSFSRYFTDGLQDWRSTFRSVKRNKDQREKPSGEQ